MFSKKQKEDLNEALAKITIPAFGYDLIRDTVLKDLLGKDYNSLLYWCGKNVARKFPLDSVEDVIQFFETSGWGQLLVLKESSNELMLTLTSELISNRFDRDIEYSYQLEAGFLAEQLQHMKGSETETLEKQKKKTNSILFTVQWEQIK